jgi:hypothetical protein
MLCTVQSLFLSIYFWRNLTYATQSSLGNEQIKSWKMPSFLSDLQLKITAASNRIERVLCDEVEISYLVCSKWSNRLHDFVVASVAIWDKGKCSRARQ